MNGRVQSVARQGSHVSTRTLKIANILLLVPVLFFIISGSLFARDSYVDIPPPAARIKVVMTAGQAVMMGKAGYEMTIKNVKPNDTTWGFVKKMYKNSLWYGSGVGTAYEQAEREEIDLFKKKIAAGESPAIHKQVTLTILKTGAYMGRDSILGIITLPGSLIIGWGDLTGANEAVAKEQWSKEYLALAKKMVLQKKEFDKALASAKSMGVRGRDVKPFLDCMCQDCGKTFGGHFNPGFNGPGIGPCQCSAPLVSTKTPIPGSKKRAYECFNLVTKMNHQEDQALFNKWHKQAMNENAKTVVKELAEVKALIKSQRQTWKEDTVKAANIYSGIKDLVLDEDKKYIQSRLTPWLINVAIGDMQNGDMSNAIQKLELAKKPGGKEKLLERLLPQYQKWEKTWGEAVTKTIPDIQNLIEKGELSAAKSKLHQVRHQMTAQGGRILPPINGHPKLLALDDLLAKKAAEARNTTTVGAASPHSVSGNLAQGKPTSQSSLYQIAGPSRAVDGNTNGHWGNGSVSHTQKNREAWWQVDLESVSHIDKVVLWNRADCCQDRLSNFYVIISEEPLKGGLKTLLSSPRVWSSHHPGQAPMSVATPVGKNGRYVRIQLAGENYLGLAEVEVMGHQASDSSVPTSNATTPTDVIGTWKINANNYPGKLEFTGTAGNLSARIYYDVAKKWEALADATYDTSTGKISFRRPWRGNPKFQVYNGELKGGSISGRFTDNNSPGKSFPWSASR